MHALRDLAEWLGLEVVEDPVAGHVVRVRQQTGKWMERDLAATAQEVHLYDALRGALRAGIVGADAASVLLTMAKAVGFVHAEEATLQEVFEGIANLHSQAARATEKLRYAVAKVEDLENRLRGWEQSDQENRLLLAQRIRRIVRELERRHNQVEDLEEVRDSRARLQGAQGLASVLTNLLGETALATDSPGEYQDPYDVVQEKVEEMKRDRLHSSQTASQIWYGRGWDEGTKAVLDLLNELRSTP